MKIRKLYFLLPGTNGKFACGGLWAELKAINLVRNICNAEVVTYRQREKNLLFLDDLLPNPNLQDVIFVVSWGFDIPKLVRNQQGHCRKHQSMQWPIHKARQLEDRLIA